MPLSKEFVEVDTTRHDVKAFDCGKPEMNEFLARYASKNSRLGLSRTWVLPCIDESRKSPKSYIAAYYTLASATVSREQIPFNKSLPRYPVPVVLLARLAVSKQFQGRRVGEKTLVTALRKSVEISDAGLPAIGLILDVLDQDALEFYRRYELFEPFTDDPMRLFVSIHTLRRVP